MEIQDTRIMLIMQGSTLTTEASIKTEDEGVEIQISGKTFAAASTSHDFLKNLLMKTGDEEGSTMTVGVGSEVARQEVVETGAEGDVECVEEGGNEGTCDWLTENQQLVILARNIMMCTYVTNFRSC